MGELPIKDDIRPEELSKALSERYLAYALSTITQRALPDARDGLKPVHRRMLHAMRELASIRRPAFKKCARVVGDVIGKFHPHGDQSVYDALVRLAQDFAVRYPLVEGQGNFGNVDGDNAAAMRYTESRLTEVAQALLEGLDENAVDFRPTYAGKDEEPVVLPAAFPNLLANGSSGIAVGMATSVPPHNLGELCQAIVALIENPELAGRARCSNSSRVRISRLAASSSTTRLPSPKPTRPAAAVSACGPTGRARKRAAACTRSSSPDSLWRAEIEADRAHRRADRAEETRAAGRRARRIRGRHPPRARAEEPNGRSGIADGAAFPAQRSRNPRAAQHERPGWRARAEGDEPARRADGVHRPSPRSAGTPHEPSPDEDRRASRSARRLSPRLSQSRQGDQDHPHRGRAQAETDEGVLALGSAG